MAKTSIDPSALGKAISEELTLYHQDVVEKVNEAGEKAVKALVKKTKATAPKRLGNFSRAITYTADRNPVTGDKEFTWGAKAPHHRLTHLLVKGHAKQNGGRVPGDPFLENALAEVLPEYERDLEEALK
jgi:hypothetical protein